MATRFFSREFLQIVEALLMFTRQDKVIREEGNLVISFLILDLIANTGFYINFQIIFSDFLYKLS